MSGEAHLSENIKQVLVFKEYETVLIIIADFYIRFDCFLDLLVTVSLKSN